MADRFPWQGRLYAGYRIGCATCTAEDEKSSTNYRVTKGFAIQWFRRMGWQRIGELWYCRDCARCGRCDESPLISPRRVRLVRCLDCADVLCARCLADHQDQAHTTHISGHIPR